MTSTTMASPEAGASGLPESPPPHDALRGRAVVEVEAPITRVVVHARGALVTREIELPADLAGGVVDLLVGGLTPLAYAGSVRAALVGSSREVAQLETALHRGAEAPEPGATRSRVRELEEQLARLKDEGARLTRRREMLANIQLAPPIRTTDRRERPRDALDARFDDALRVAALVSKTTHGVDEALAAVRRELAEVERTLEAARLADAQASRPQRAGDAHPTRVVIVRLQGEWTPGPQGRLVITYAVPAARFWPSYTLRLSEGGKRASWTFAAILAQRTGEDWSGVPLSLSTGDLAFDARLPELSSLRIGRRTEPKRRLFRPPPEGVETMFSFYLAFTATLRPSSLPPSRRATSEELGRVEDEFSTGAAAPLEDDGEDDGDRVTPVDDGEPRFARRVPPKASARPAFGAPPPAPRMEMLAAMPMAASMPMPAPKKAMRSRAAMALPGSSAPGGAADYGGASTGARMDLLESASEPEPEPEPALVPSGAWEDYDRLLLAPPEDAWARGRLIMVADPAVRSAAERAILDIERASVPGHVDPRESRGMFDHRYEAEGACDVPSDGRVHRVPISVAECASRLHYTTVPIEAPEVYREAVLANPFSGPLLAGPVDVYLDGTLLTTTRTAPIDRGGELRVGMGVDDRLTVARNVRVAEESVGLIGGSRGVTHTVAIELSASVRDPVKVTVLERVPVSDDKAIKIEVVSERPSSVTYDQSERGAAVRGARRYELTLEPGKKERVELVYRLVFANKLDVVGGSRRG